jgi:hypothetical protein
MLSNFAMALSNGYTHTYVADGRPDAVELAKRHLDRLRDSGDAAARTEFNRSIRTVKSVRPVKSVHTSGARVFTISGIIQRENEEAIVGCWHVRVPTPDDAVAMFNDYARINGGVAVVASVIRGKQTAMEISR